MFAFGPFVFPFQFMLVLKMVGPIEMGRLLMDGMAVVLECFAGGGAGKIRLIRQRLVVSAFRTIGRIGFSGPRRNRRDCGGEKESGKSQNRQAHNTAKMQANAPPTCVQIGLVRIVPSRGMLTLAPRQVNDHPTGSIQTIPWP